MVKLKAGKPFLGSRVANDISNDILIELWISLGIPSRNPIALLSLQEFPISGCCKNSLNWEIDGNRTPYKN